MSTKGQGTFKVDRPNLNSDFKQQKIKYFAGTKFKSRNGCLTCKKKRRKCDENTPVCLYCKSKGFQCVYKDKKGKLFPNDRLPTKVEDLKHTREDKNRYTSSKKREDNSLIKASSPQSLVTVPPIDVNKITEIFSLSEIADNTSECSEESNPSIAQLDLSGCFPDFSTLSSLPSIYLNDTGRHYLEYFQVEASKSLALSQDHNNYFKKLYYLLSHTEESFTYLIAAWGGLYFKNKQMDSEIEYYIKKSQQKFSKLFGNNFTTFDYYFKLCYFLMLTEMTICTGDTNTWLTYYNIASELFKNYGGMEKLSKDFGHSHEIRFMISNHLYNDLMSSRTITNGTINPVEEYEAVFSKESFKKYELSYGFDTMLGLHQPLIFLMGKILNTKVKLSNSWKELELLGTSENSESEWKEYLDLVKLETEILSNELESIQPNKELLDSIKNDPKEYSVYKGGYDLYKIICDIYFLMYIKRLSPSSLEIQTLVNQGLGHLEYLIDTKMCVVLCLPALVCGICCITRFDKFKLETLIQKLDSKSPVKNIDKCWMIIQRSWEINPSGNMVIDWGEICEEFGWVLNIC